MERFFLLVLMHNLDCCMTLKVFSMCHSVMLLLVIIIFSFVCLCVISFTPQILFFFICEAQCFVLYPFHYAVKYNWHSELMQSKTSSEWCNSISLMYWSCNIYMGDIIIGHHACLFTLYGFFNDPVSSSYNVLSKFCVFLRKYRIDPTVTPQHFSWPCNCMLLWNPKMNSVII